MEERPGQQESHTQRLLYSFSPQTFLCISTPRYEARSSYNATVEAVRCSCGAKELKIIVLELAALVLSDKKYEQLEKDFMTDLMLRLHISVGEFDSLINSIQVLNKTYSELDAWIQA